MCHEFQLGRGYYCAWEAKLRETGSVNCTQKKKKKKKMRVFVKGVNKYAIDLPRRWKLKVGKLVQNHRHPVSRLP